jgi:L-rhamnose mutarotase
MQIYLLGRRMFMHMTTVEEFEPAVDFPRYAQHPRAREWDDLMRGFQERVPEAKEGEWWALMEPVFDLDWPQHRPPPA